MQSMCICLVSRLKREEGQGMVEYALIIVLVAIAVITALQLVGGTLDSTYNSIANSIKSVS